MKRNSGKVPTAIQRMIPIQKDRKIFICSVGLALLLVLCGLATLRFSGWYVSMADGKPYQDFVKQIGSVARIVYFAVLAIFPIFLLLKWKWVRTLKIRQWEVKKWLQWTGKAARLWHVPLAWFGIVLTLFHGGLALRNGFKWDFSYATGMLALLPLPVLIYSGLKRYRRRDRKFHLLLAAVFLTLFMIHAA